MNPFWLGLVIGMTFGLRHIFPIVSGIVDMWNSLDDLLKWGSISFVILYVSLYIFAITESGLPEILILD